MYKAQYIDYNPHKGLTGEMAEGHECIHDKSGYFITVTELHGTEESARVRARAKQWCLVSVEPANKPAGVKK